MMARTACLLLLGLGVCEAAQTAVQARLQSRNQAVQMVLDLMAEMLEKAETTKREESNEFGMFTFWCDKTRAQKEGNIAAAAAAIDQLSNDINNINAALAKLTKGIDKLNEHIATEEATLATQVGDEGVRTAEYNQAAANFKATNVALQQSIETLNKQDEAMPQSVPDKAINYDPDASSFVQVSQTIDPKPQYEAPVAPGYEFQSGGVVKILKKLKERFTAELADLDQAHIAAVGRHDLYKQAAQNTIKTLSEERNAKQADADAQEATKALKMAENNAQEEHKLRQEQDLSEMNDSCHDRSRQFEASQIIFADEITTLAKAIDVVKTLPVKGDASAFAQLRMASQKEGEDLGKVQTFMEGRAKELNSRYLSLVASRSLVDDTNTVKKLLWDLILQLQSEIALETSVRQRCESELQINARTRQKATQEVSRLTSETTKNDEELASLTANIDANDARLAESNLAVAEAAQNRLAERATNQATIKDAKDGQLVISRALLIINEFYQRHSDTPAGDKVYNPSDGEQQNIANLLDVILSDCSKLRIEVQNAEEEQDTAHLKYLRSAKVQQAGWDAENKEMNSRRTWLTEQNTNEKKLLTETQTELDKANTLYEQLKPSCENTGYSDEERHARRAEEIKALRTALDFLGGK